MVHGLIGIPISEYDITTISYAVQLALLSYTLFYTVNEIMLLAELFQDRINHIEASRRINAQRISELACYMLAILVDARTAWMYQFYLHELEWMIFGMSMPLVMYIMHRHATHQWMVESSSVVQGGVTQQRFARIRAGVYLMHIFYAVYALLSRLLGSERRYMDDSLMDSESGRNLLKLF